MNEHRPAFVELPTVDGPPVILAAALVDTITHHVTSRGRPCSAVFSAGGDPVLIDGEPRNVALALASAMPGFVHGWTAKELAAFIPTKTPHDLRGAIS